MAVNFSGVAFNVISGLSMYVFGNMQVTTISIILFFTLLAILIQIPFPYAIAMQIPLIAIFTAFNFMSILTGGLFAGVYMVIAVGTFLSGFGLNQ